MFASLNCGTFGSSFVILFINWRLRTTGRIVHVANTCQKCDNWNSHVYNTCSLVDWFPIVPSTHPLWGGCLINLLKLWDLFVYFSARQWISSCILWHDFPSWIDQSGFILRSLSARFLARIGHLSGYRHWLPWSVLWNVLHHKIIYYSQNSTSSLCTSQ